MHVFYRSNVCYSSTTADQVDERCNRRSMVRLGVRVIHKISAEARAEPIIEPGASTNTLSKSLRSRLSPKALKLANKFSTSVDENQHRRLQTTKPNSGSMSRIDIENRTHELTDNRQSKVSLFFICLRTLKKIDTKINKFKLIFVLNFTGTRMFC